MTIIDNILKFLKGIHQKDYIKLIVIIVLVYAFSFIYNNFAKISSCMTPDETETFGNNVNSDYVLSSKSQPIAYTPPTNTVAPTTVDQSSSDATLNKILSNQTLTTSDLLPVYDDANEFSKQNPTQNLLKEQNFLASSPMSGGLDTVVQSKKIAYHDIRSAPPIPKGSPFGIMESSYQEPAGFGRRPLE